MVSPSFKFYSPLESQNPSSMRIDLDSNANFIPSESRMRESENPYGFKYNTVPSKAEQNLKSKAKR